MRAFIVDKMEVFSISLYHQRISGETYLALKGLPEVRDVVISALDSVFGPKPFHKALEMNVSHSSSTLAAAYQWVVYFGMLRPAKPTQWCILFVM